MPGTVFLVVSSDPQRLLRAGTWALTAASVDDPTTVLLCAPALRALLDDAPIPALEGGPAPATLRLPGWRGSLEEAQSLGATVVTCDTELALAGLTVAPPPITEVVSLPSFWRTHVGARLVVV